VFQSLRRSYPTIAGLLGWHLFDLEMIPASLEVRFGGRDADVMNVAFGVD
jgi:hypothetical protein